MKNKSIFFWLFVLLTFCNAQGEAQKSAGTSDSIPNVRPANRQNNAQALFPRATVSQPIFLLNISGGSHLYQPEALNTIHKLLELLNYRVSDAKLISPHLLGASSLYLGEFLRARTEKMMVTVTFSEEKYPESDGLDALLAVQANKPLDTKLFINSMIQLAVEQYVKYPRIDNNGILFQIDSVQLALQFFQDDTVLLLGRPSTIRAVLDGKTHPVNIPASSKATPNSLLIHLGIQIPKLLHGDMDEEIMNLLPEELKKLPSTSLNLQCGNPLRCTLNTTFETTEDASDFAQYLNRALPDLKSMLIEEPTIAKYLDMVKIATKGRFCQASVEMPWQVCLGTVFFLGTKKEFMIDQQDDCIMKLKTLGLTALMYADDHDDFLPSPQTWQKELMDYGFDCTKQTCPCNPKEKYIYLGKRIKLSDIRYPSKTILFYENLRNHSSTDSVHILFGDGHVSSFVVDTMTSIEEIAETYDLYIIK